MTRGFRFYTREHAERQMTHYRDARTTFGSKALCRELRRYAELGDRYPFKQKEVYEQYDRTHAPRNRAPPSPPTDENHASLPHLS